MSLAIGIALIILVAVFAASLFGVVLLGILDDLVSMVQRSKSGRKGRSKAWMQTYTGLGGSKKFKFGDWIFVAAGLSWVIWAISFNMLGSQ